MKKITKIGGHKIYQADLFIAKTVCTYDVPFIAAVKRRFFKTHIIVNKCFLELSEELKEAAYAHELGHIELGHVDDLSKNGSEGLIIISELELAADRYAVKRVSPGSLIALLSTIEGYYTELSIPVLGLEERYSALNQMKIRSVTSLATEIRSGTS